jgi:hypothetical protein
MEKVKEEAKKSEARLSVRLERLKEDNDRMKKKFDVTNELVNGKEIALTKAENLIISK